MFNIEVIDLGINNISSVVRALNQQDNVRVTVVQTASDSNEPSLLVLPGLGYYEKGIHALETKGFRSLLVNAATADTPIAGICLGMQLLGDSSEESPTAEGLGLIQGKCLRFPILKEERVPNVGWNSTFLQKNQDEFSSLNSGSDFYFVHSYYFSPESNSDILSTTKYGNMEFPSSILRNRVAGFQFHPEKSSQAGRKLISDLVEWAKK